MFRTFARVTRTASTRTGASYARTAVRRSASTVATPNYFNGRAFAAMLMAGAGAMYMLSEDQKAAAASNIPPHGVPGTKNERTFIAVKPDGVQRGIVGEIIRRFETKGYKLVAIKMITPTEKFAAQHYDDLSSKPFFGGLVKFFSSGPVVAMVWEGAGVIKGGRTLLGATNPADSAPGSIRGDLSVVVGRNICHGSDSAESAKDEIALWWKPEEIQNYERPQDAWVYEK